MLGGSPIFQSQISKTAQDLLCFGKKIAEHWDKKVPSFNDGLLKLATRMNL